MAGEVDIIARIQHMPMKQKASLVVTVALVIAAGIMLMSWLQKADLQLLYSNLSEEDAGAIAQKLTEMKVPYQAVAGGVMVPADKVYDLRLQLAAQGLPQGGSVGFELFDKTSFTMTDFVQKLNYRRALQGELSRTVRSLAEVDQCRVHLASPEKTLFTQKADRPKASVLVKLKAGRKLSPAQVQGIVHLVSSSVESLDPKDVMVIDTSGEMLTIQTDEAMAASAGQMDHQRAFERDLEGRILAILEPVVGAGKARAKVAANFDYTKTEKTEERFDPDSQVARSEQRNVEKSTTGGSGGIPGTTSNLPGGAARQTGASGSLSEKKAETINYEISKTVSRIMSPAAELKRLTAVVLVDGMYAATPDSAEKKYTARTEDELRQFEDMVKKAVGFTTDRGDEVKVVNMPFEAATQEEIVETKDTAATLMPVAIIAGKFIVPLIAVLLLFSFVIKPLMKTVTAPLPALPPQSLALPQTVAELERVAQQKELSAQDKLVEWAKQNPQEAGSLVRKWLKEK